MSGTSSAEAMAETKSRWRRIRTLWVRAGLVLWVVMPVLMVVTFRAQGLPDDIWSSTASIRFDREERWLSFRGPSDEAIRIVLIPGCPVQADAYAPFARDLAAHGLAAMVMQVPYWCAPLPAQEAALDRRVLEASASCGTCPWILAGHSRGVSHALRIAGRRPPRLAGLVLIASTHPREIDYSHLTIPVLKIAGTEDGVAPLASVRANAHLLPASTTGITIDGGNHAQFAHYGFQLFDGRARISRAEQQAQAVQAIIGHVAKVSPSRP
jgi:pimeloyl-ACP methyl ester carboxylesterase